jgi:hypothetical protein
MWIEFFDEVCHCTAEGLAAGYPLARANMAAAAATMMIAAPRNSRRCARWLDSKWRIRTAVRMNIEPTASNTRTVSGTSISAQVCIEIASRLITSGNSAR